MDKSYNLWGVIFTLTVTTRTMFSFGQSNTQNLNDCNDNFLFGSAGFIRQPVKSGLSPLVYAVSLIWVTS